MNRLRSEEGITLPEVMMAALVGFVVLSATLGLLETSLRLTGGAMAKTDAMQRGRLAMDRITQQLRSQICLDGAVQQPAVVPTVTTDSAITFYADFSDGAYDAKPVKRTLTYDPAKRTIVETSVVGAGPVGGPYTFTGAVRRSLVYENANLLKDKNGVTIPFLKYYAYEESGTPKKLQATKALSAPLNADRAALVARIDVNFMARPTGANDDSKGIRLSERVSVRHADPNIGDYDPMCS